MKFAELILIKAADAKFRNLCGSLEGIKEIKLWTVTSTRKRRQEAAVLF